MPILQRLGTINTLTALLERAVRWGPPIVGTVGLGTFSGWATAATRAFSDYAPASWIFGGILGGLLFIFGYWLFASARMRLARAQFTQEMLTRAPSVNPLDETFTKQRIDINIFKRPPPEAAIGKTFIGCDIYGPANIILNGYTNLTGPGNIAGTCDFVMVKVNHPIANAIAFQDTTFSGCNMYNITFFIPEYLAKSFPAVGPNWITPNSPAV